MSKDNHEINIEDGNSPEKNREQAAGKPSSSTSETASEEHENGSSEEGGEQPESQDPLDKAIEDNLRLKDRLLRTMAEFDNYKKRTLREKADLILNGGEKVITAILPVLDDMERAMANASKLDDKQKVEEGWELIYKKLQKTLEGMGLSKIDTDGRDFDTDFHEAVAMVPGMGDDKKGKVIDCVQTGYMLNDKVLRHAKVAVGQ